MSTPHAARAAAVAGFLGLAIGMAGCGAGVKQEEYNTEVAKLREEIQTGDRQLADRVDSINQVVDSTNRVVAAQQARIDAMGQEFQALRDDYQVSMEKVKGQLRFDVPVHFDFDRSELREADLPVLDRFAGVVRDYYAGALVTVEGFADPAGDYAYNLSLGQARADVVRSYLVTTAALPAESVRAVSYGEVLKRQVVPGAKGPGDTGIENRRVTLVIDHAAVATDQLSTP
jgi:peptidoglycan-associated lipoprotein